MRWACLRCLALARSAYLPVGIHKIRLSNGFCPFFLSFAAIGRSVALRNNTHSLMVRHARHEAIPQPHPELVEGWDATERERRMATPVQDTIERVREIDVDKYKYGFTTEIESVRAPKGLDESTLRYISPRNRDP